MANLEKLELLRTTKQDIKAAIEEKGQETGEIPFSGYAEKIRAISGGAAGEDALLTAILEGDSIEGAALPPVTEIREYAFAWHAGLALTELPEEVTAIGSYAFEYCGGLALTKLPDGLKKINPYTFYCCTELAITALPPGVTSIGTQAFGICTGLKELQIPASVTTVGSNAFMNCTGLTSVTFLGKPRTINSSAFSLCRGLTINVPWAQGAVSGAPWGAVNATIHYNYNAEET